MRKTNLLYEEKDSREIHLIYSFDNKYGASVIKNSVSMGHEQNLWELALLVFDRGVYVVIEDESLFEIVTEEKPTADSVLGYLTEEQVDEILNKIENYKEPIWN